MTVTGKRCCVTMQAAYRESVAKSGVTSVSTVYFERSIKQCVEYDIAFNQNVLYGIIIQSQ